MKRKTRVVIEVDDEKKSVMVVDIHRTNHLIDADAWKLGEFGITWDFYRKSVLVASYKVSEVFSIRIVDHEWFGNTKIESEK